MKGAKTEQLIFDKATTLSLLQEIAMRCIYCHKPADSRCRNVIQLPSGSRVHGGCHHRLLIELAEAAARPAQEQASSLLPLLEASLRYEKARNGG